MFYCLLRLVIAGHIIYKIYSRMLKICVTMSPGPEGCVLCIVYQCFLLVLATDKRITGVDIASLQLFNILLVKIYI